MCVRCDFYLRAFDAVKYTHAKREMERERETVSCAAASAPSADWFLTMPTNSISIYFVLILFEDVVETQV